MYSVATCKDSSEEINFYIHDFHIWHFLKFIIWQSASFMIVHFHFIKIGALVSYWHCNKLPQMLSLKKKICFFPVLEVRSQKCIERGDAFVLEALGKNPLHVFSRFFRGCSHSWNHGPLLSPEPSIASIQPLLLWTHHFSYSVSLLHHLRNFVIILDQPG